ncbi:Bleomycin resistance protein [Asticcacaulis sp. MM231]|uniref:bleomycin resistance protein n=1 Tax=Asticcacaulis sp. MM231 TaxID=3157666 RepID=UPI0032D5AA31
MTDRITANLPAIDFGATSEFYQALGFKEDFHDSGWMILSRGPLVIEFFPYPNLNPYQSSFSACVRVDDVDGLYTAWAVANLPKTGVPRLTAPVSEVWGFRASYLVDPNGSLLRCLTKLD